MPLLNQEQHDFLVSQYKKDTLKNCLQKINDKFCMELTYNQISGYVSRNKIKSGRTGQFIKKQIPWNLGKKGYMGKNKTSFKKGYKPPNLRLFYSEREGKNGLIEIKINGKNKHTGYVGVWKSKQSYLYEVYSGNKVLDGEVVIFKDGNIRNFNFDNLVKLKRSELLALNNLGGHKIPKDFKDLAITTAKIKAKIYEFTNKGS